MTEPRQSASEPDPRDVLIEARKLIEDPERWITGAFGRRPDGSLIYMIRASRGIETAEAFCASGAIARASGVTNPQKTRAYRVLQEAFDATEPICQLNDAASHAEVLAAFDRAIADTESDAP